MNIIQQNTQTAKSQLIVKIRASLYQLPNGELVGFGPLEAKRGNGYEFCYNCNVSDCVHVVAVSQAWLGGMSVEAQSGTFNGYHTPSTVTAPPFTLTQPTQADIDAVNEGNKPGAWRARSIEEMPSTWTRTVLQ